MIPCCITPDITPSPRDTEIAERLLVAYTKSKEDETHPSSEFDDVWSRIQSRQKPFFSLLEHRDPKALATYLCNMYRHDATFGICQGDTEYTKLRYNPLYRRQVSLYMKGMLVSLAEATGAIPYENPEQGSCGKSIRISIDRLEKSITDRIGFDISPPNIDGGLFKICGTRSQFTDRDLNAIYTAWYISNVLGIIGPVCEIGAGVGRAAYWGLRFGITSYTIIDLPHVNILQGFYLIRAFPEGTVRLYGEPESSDNGISILPNHCIDKLPRDTFELVLNQDSFPEINADVVRGYLKMIRKISYRYFLSVNHESSQNWDTFSQNRVSDLVNRFGGYELRSRTPYWLRRGYVMELFEV